jgi:O-antigen ligase
MTSPFRRIGSGVSDWLRAEKPDRAVVALAILAALVAAVVCAPNGYVHSGIGIPPEAAWAVLVLGIAVAALAALRPWYGLQAWIVIMPLFTAARIGIEFGWVQITPSTILLGTLLIAVLLRFRTARPALPTVPLVLAGMLALLAALATAFSADQMTGVSITVHGLIEPIGLGLLLILMRPGLRKLVALPVAMTASVTIAGIINASRVLLIVHSASDFQSLRGELGRITYFNVGLYGGILVTVLPLMAVLIARPALLAEGLERATGAASRAVGRTAAPWRPETCRRAATLIRIAAWVALAFALVIVDFTFSKSAWIASLVLGLALVVMVPRTWRLRAAGLGVVAVFVGLFVVTNVVTNAPTSDRSASWDPNSTEGDVSVTGRLLATEAAMYMTIDHPLLGVGPGLFGVEYGGPYYNPQAHAVLQSAHDLIANVAAEYGLPVAAILGLLILSSLWVAWRLWRSGAGLAKLLALAYGLSLVGFMIVATLFGSDLYRGYRFMNTDVLYAGLVMGAIAVLAELAKDPRGESAPEE